MEWTLLFFFLRQIIYFSCVNHSMSADHWTLINVIIQLSEALCFSLSRFHLQTLITGWIGSTFWETKQGRSVHNAKRCPGSSQKHRDHWDPVVCGMAKAILSFHWFHFSRRDHSLLPFTHHWQVLAGCTTHQTPSLRQRREDRFLSRSKHPADKLLALKTVRVDEQKPPLAWAKTVGSGHLDSNPRNFREKLCGPSQGM